MSQVSPRNVACACAHTDPASARAVTGGGSTIASHRPTLTIPPTSAPGDMSSTGAGIVRRTSSSTPGTRSSTVTVGTAVHAAPSGHQCDDSVCPLQLYRYKVAEPVGDAAIAACSSAARPLTTG